VKVAFVRGWFTDLEIGGRRIVRIYAIDSEGRFWERFSDDPPGWWSLIEGPDEPDANGSLPPLPPVS
jgi:hypothetical protein